MACDKEGYKYHRWIINGFIDTFSGLARTGCFFYKCQRCGERSNNKREMKKWPAKK